MPKYVQETAFPFAFPTPPSSSHSAKFNPATFNILHAPHAKRKPSIIHAALLDPAPDSESEPEFYSESEYSSTGAASTDEEYEVAHYGSPANATAMESDAKSYRNYCGGTEEERKGYSTEAPQDQGPAEDGTAGKLATTAHAMRASRISFHGASWRVLPA
jgi:hypothetical protein